MVSANGKVIPSARTKTIASVDVSAVRAILVSEGQLVKAGEVLIELDSSSSDAERDKAADAVAQARLQAARAQAMMEAIQNLRTPELAQVPGVAQAQWEAVDRKSVV